ncbi:MAG TPA: hypothetical protein VJP87_00110 [Candidatus Acidoferrales bacterium]|nr:hypothetical protein [Candidatus Acidoferrales bacterium]
MPRWRTLRLSLAFLFGSALSLCAQDMPLRVEALKLLNHANEVSRSASVLPNRRLDVAFRAFGLDGTEKDGTYSVMYAVDSERFETHFGEYT